MASDVIRVPIAEAAARLGFSAKTLRRRAAAGLIVIEKDGGRDYVPEASLRAYAGCEATARAGAPSWQSLPDLRVLFAIPELEERRREDAAARQRRELPGAQEKP